MLSSSTNESRLSRENSIINEDTSIDDIFTHLTIPQIQKLNKEYKQNVTNAKNDLHGLVGNKYRDLIKIAEDISNMYAVTSEVDQKLSDLSYGQSRFVSFNTLNSFSKYSSSIRRKDASEARRNEKLTILKNIINNQLVSFEIRLLSSHQRPPLKNTANYIYYAKCFYTLECIFEDTLKAEKHLADKLTAFKASFVTFLEAELASYNAFSLTSYSNDAGNYKPSQNLVWEDFVNISSGYLVNDDLDDFDEDDEEEDDEMRLHDTDHIEDSDPEETLHETYNKVSPPIINYLIAYIILNHKNEKMHTLTKVHDKFIKLRYDFLDNVLKKILSTSQPANTCHINFYKIFKYIENTCDYVSRYFNTEKATKNELLKDLKQATGTWKASSLIGFHNWIENENVEFNYDLILIDICNSEEVSINEFPDLLARFSDNLIKQISNGSEEGISSLSNSFVIFHNFIISLKKLDVSMIGNGSNSKLIELLSNSLKNNNTIATTLLENVISKTNHIYTILFDNLSCKSKLSTNILSTIKGIVANKNFNSGTKGLELFSSDLVETIDTDLNKYIDFVAQISSLPSLSTANHDICHQINIWFDTYLEYSDIINIKKDFDLNRLTPSNCLSHLSEVLSKNKSSLTGKWGNFTRELMLKEFKALTENFNETLYNKIDDIIEEIGILIDDSEKNNDVETLYYLLRVLLTLLERLVNFDKNQNDRICKPVSALLASCKDIFSTIVKKIPYISNNNEPSFMESFDKFVTNLFSNSSDVLSLDLPNRPSLRLSSLVFYLSSTYLTPFSADYAKDCDYGKLFLNKHVNEMFTELKREWILEDLIQKKVIDKLPSSANNTDDIKEPIKSKDEHLSTNNEIDDSSITKEKYHLVFANVVYLLQFANGAPISDMTNSLIQDHVRKLNAATGNKIDEPSMKHIIKNISEFYKSNKGICLPLLIS
ncbi:uncharacterized protein AC631_04273 [Debaryomyces fabryi]|uniref:Uncharacterized protein n=1 Tax=Debaryomyces fabryi TaxID=58627 RepID=A0A0V1PV44_9ASCO|nr:uncharacterized protein AC631_04273 [Debaryomyces fabryi]KRZ99977.1 hypothetical protein AC631_04273 [Debaryomyces fabryi]CUM53220.1 unnamed protein product [Debaryomyces fabryi]